MISDEQLNEFEEDALKTGYDLEHYAPLIGDIVKSLRAERRWSAKLEKALEFYAGRESRCPDGIYKSNLGDKARAVLARKQEILTNVRADSKESSLEGKE